MSQIVVLVDFLLLHILNRKRTSNFFWGIFQSHSLISSDDQYDRTKPTVLHRDLEQYSTKQEKKAAGDQIDQSPMISRGDLGLVLTSLGLLVLSDGEEEAKIPAKLDADEIFDIFEKKSPCLDEVKEAFDVFDSNRDGFIDAEELQKVLLALGLKEGLEIEKCSRMIGVFDENGDGRLDFQEFVKFMEISFS